VERRAVGLDGAAIPGNDGVHPIVVNIAIEDFLPLAAAGKADLIVEPVAFVEAGDNDDIGSRTFHPVLKREHAVVVVNVNEATAFTS